MKTEESNDYLTVLLLCAQAVDDVGRGQIKPVDRLYELKALQEQEKKVEVQCKSDASN